ncbi:MAG TPA: cupin domain-containing protein [Flexistipes sinusarabici]|uniref:Cupin domain-containing protein n=1 Tax=Flexistipes sinusarabici TaxID=2352 RepID=A0A3D5QBM3_FLESI|nr:cupin domain-containing protein [Flexistipes sinusarabici]
MKITKKAEQQPVQGPENLFTGEVRIDPLFLDAEEPSRVTAAKVTFQPGARTAWHSHPIGQNLVVVSGKGLVQRDGEEIKEIEPGDVVWFDAEEVHWHGAAPDSEMSHIAIQEEHEGKAADWYEKVTDEEYSKR